MAEYCARRRPFRKAFIPKRSIACGTQGHWRRLAEGVEIHEIDGVSVRIYNPEKTIADCVKFRNQLGLDTVIEAVRFYRERSGIKVDDLMHYAEICRERKTIRPYLDAIL